MPYTCRISVRRSKIVFATRFEYATTVSFSWVQRTSYPHGWCRDQVRNRSIARFYTDRPKQLQH